MTISGNGRHSAWRSLVEVHARVTRRIEGEIEQNCGIPLIWYELLAQVGQSEGQGLRMFDLAERVLLSRSGLTRLVDRMEEAGLVARTGVARDRRGTLVTITQQGAALLVEAAPVYQKGVEECFTQHVTPDEAATLQRIFDRILESQRSGVR
jgi:DNA-binding MarR family transcriptional regulator